jgi:hypothetical protein
MEYIFGRRSDGVENLLTKGKEAYFFYTERRKNESYHKKKNRKSAR